MPKYGQKWSKFVGNGLNLVNEGQNGVRNGQILRYKWSKIYKT